MVSPLSTLPPSRRPVLACWGLVVAVAGGAIDGLPDPIPEAPVSAVARDPATGDTWSATLGSGLLRTSAGRLDRFTQFNSGLAGDVLFDVKVWRDRVYAATTRGISGYDPRTEKWTLHLERRRDVAPIVIVRLLVLPSDPTRPSGESTLHGCSSDGRPFRFDAVADDWLLSPDREATAACASAPNEVPKIAMPRSDRRSDLPSAPGLAIGILIPMSRGIAVPGEIRGRTDELLDRVAVEDLLARRTARQGVPIELSRPVFTYERHYFGTPDDTLTILALRPEVAGVVGLGVTRASVESLLASRLGIPIVDAAPIGPGARESADPWVFRCDRYGHDGQAAVLDALLADLRVPRLAVVRTPGAEVTRRLDFWVRRAADLGAVIAADVAWDPGTEDVGPVLARLRSARVRAVLTWSDARASSRLLSGMRQTGLDAAFVGGPGIVNDDFARSAASEAEMILAVSPCPHEGANDGSAPASLRERTVEATAHLLAAIEVAGRNREAVRGTLQRMRSGSVARLRHRVWGLLAYGHESPSRDAPFDRLPSDPSPDGQALVARTR